MEEEDSEQSGIYDEPERSTAAAAAEPIASRVKKRKLSLFRVGSNEKNNNRGPGSPTRASNYNHVRKAVAINFQEAEAAASRKTLGVVGTYRYSVPLV